MTDYEAQYLALCAQHPELRQAELAKPLATITLTGAFVEVQYSYRKTPDLYVAVDGHPVSCCQCEAAFPPEELQAHILKFYRKRHEPPE